MAVYFWAVYSETAHRFGIIVSIIKTPQKKKIKTKSLLCILQIVICSTHVYFVKIYAIMQLVLRIILERKQC